jgi:hypothetical protein
MTSVIWKCNRKQELALLIQTSSNLIFPHLKLFTFVRGEGSKGKVEKSALNPAGLKSKTSVTEVQHLRHAPIKTPYPVLQIKEINSFSLS